ncbi:hypothetical protein DNL40_02800 [Xylanimonas oleitrophica]|uniref:Uncharacterized protein n=1 Tax=Xylanimonas oleitrophica TaxID=2607479 RepID=A0A2W5WVI2_9MICO|nr:hypothetical protein [Xylanimonas oleitrophica]PZR55317.1 hypothetical protein DNL40_02800 [Xylanimonas oleitrophica]
MGLAPLGSLYAFPSDLLDEGPAQVAHQARDLGFGSLAVAVAYHQARDVVPHAGPRRLRYRQDGVFLTLDERRWHGASLRPLPQPADETRAVQELLALDDRPAVEAWTVFLHNTSLGAQHPGSASQTCFGDALLSNLCPSSPAVRAYATALADEVASRGTDVVAEALSAQTFAHGHHHERSFAPVGPGAEAVLGLCFCTGCSTGAADAGADVERLAASARAVVDAAFDGAAPFPATLDALTEVLGEDLGHLLRARSSAVTSLAAQVAAVVRSHGQRLAFMDLTGAVLGYDDGLPEGAPAAAQAWRLAIDPAAVARESDAYVVLGYAADPERLAADVASVREAVGSAELRVILRPGHPDTRSAEHLRSKVAAATEAGADRIEIYSYGMAPRPVLERVRLPYAPGATQA